MYLIKENIINCILISNYLTSILKIKLNYSRKKNNNKFIFFSILIGENYSNNVYIIKKFKIAKLLGIKNYIKFFSRKCKKKKIFNFISKLNKIKHIGGTIVQLPVINNNIEKNEIFKYIYKFKDLDCLTPKNLGNLFLYKNSKSSCITESCMILFKLFNIKFKNKKILIINESELIGKQLVNILVSKGSVISICNGFNSNLKNELLISDIIISATGNYNSINRNHIKNNCIIFDLGISKKNGKTVGDINFKLSTNKIKLITTIPGGIGLINVLILMKNVFKTYCI